MVVVMEPSACTEDDSCATGQAVLLARNQLGLQQPRALMRLIKLKGIERGREHHLRTVSEDNGLQHVDRLGNIGHLAPGRHAC